MPIYEYQCPACELVFEKEHGIKEAPVVSCPSCEYSGATRLISRTSFSLKGQGWCNNGYKLEKEYDK